MTYLAEVLMLSDRPWLTGIVDYANLVGYCFNNMRVRSELRNLATLVGWCVSACLYSQGTVRVTVRGYVHFKEFAGRHNGGRR